MNPLKAYLELHPEQSLHKLSQEHKIPYATLWREYKGKGIRSVRIARQIAAAIGVKPEAILLKGE